ncbi:MAG TPA: hypothetical protein VJ765_13345, partial [Chitinophagaceae bacterium]|nr:hypothetical protein [Chitinophagaceae bacterium]
MKPIIKFTACIVLIWLVSIASCKDPLPNHSPVASAGQDIVIVLPTCRNDTTGSTDLDGTGSTDPDNNITSYSWRRVSGPGTYYLGNSTSAKARVENMAIGEYVFELRVADAGGLSSTDNVKVIVKGTVREHDLDITFNGTFIFSEDVCFPSYYYYSNCSYYYDMTEIRGNGQFLPIGDFSINVSEYADVNDLSDAHSTFIFIYPNPGNLN